MQSRDPKRMPPRVANGPTFLAGLVRCGYCGAALIQNTGKGGMYRYYCCSRKLKEGPRLAEGFGRRWTGLTRSSWARSRGASWSPNASPRCCEAYVRAGSEREDRTANACRSYRQSHTRAEAAHFAPAGAGREGADGGRGPQPAREPDRAQGTPRRSWPRRWLTCTAHRVRRAPDHPREDRPAIPLLRDKLYHGLLELRQAYARLVMDEVTVSDEEIRISGSKAVLARCAAAEEIPSTPAVLSFVREWRAIQDKTANTYVIEIPI